MNQRQIFIYFAWIVAFVSTLGSLFFSKFLSLPPCDLCWYQRIFMFPLVVILGLGFANDDRGVHIYSLPLIVIGWMISIYHNLLYYKWIEPAITPCGNGVSCTEKQIEWFGFVSIPAMSFIAFTILLILLSLHYFSHLKKQGDFHHEKK